MMKNSFNNINAQIVQMGDTISNAGPLLAQVEVLRDQVADALAGGDVPPRTANALEQAVADAVREAEKAAPRRSRLRDILSTIAALSSGFAATAGLAETVDSVLQIVAGPE
jgi:hypothetical protein